MKSQTMNISTETHPWTETFPLRTIKTNEYGGRMLDDYIKKRVYIKNSSGTIDTDSKYWNLVKVLKSSTKVICWLVKMHSEYFVVSQSKIQLFDDVVCIHEADRRGRYDIMNPSVIYGGYIDMESAMDNFAQEYMALMINERHPEVEFLF